MASITVTSRKVDKATTQGPQTRPKRNIMIVVLDDIGLPDLPAWKLDSPLNSGFNQHALTPNMDALMASANGFRFRSMIAAPNCSPCRVAFNTGRYALRTGCGTVITDNNATSTFSELPQSEIMLCKVAKAAGYETAYIGKWHMALPTASMIPESLAFGSGWDHPTLMGWDRARISWQNLDRAPIPPESGGYKYGYYNFWWFDSINGTYADGNQPEQVVGNYHTVKVRQSAQNSMTTMREPWLCVICLSAAHSPYGPPTGGTTWSGCMPPEAITHSPPGTYDPTVGNSARAVWDSTRAAIEAIDYEIFGTLLDNLGASLLSRTDIICFGDNGPAGTVWQSAVTLGVPNLGLMTTLTTQGRLKSSPWEAGIRVPGFIYGPSVRNGPRATRRMCDATDIYDTARHLMQGTFEGVVPGSTKLDGVSWAAQAFNTAAVAHHPKKQALAEIFAPNGDPGAATERQRNFRRWASDGNLYSLVRILGSGDTFYQLKDSSLADIDPWQQVNLGTGHAMFQETAIAFQELLSSDN